jgi:hypothetical protein
MELASLLPLLSAAIVSLDIQVDVPDGKFLAKAGLERELSILAENIHTRSPNANDFSFTLSAVSGFGKDKSTFGAMCDGLLKVLHLNSRIQRLRLNQRVFSRLRPQLPMMSNLQSLSVLDCRYPEKTEASTPVDFGSIFPELRKLSGDFGKGDLAALCLPCGPTSRRARNRTLGRGIRPSGLPPPLIREYWKLMPVLATSYHREVHIHRR